MALTVTLLFSWTKQQQHFYLYGLNSNIVIFKVYVTFATSATLSKIDLNKQGLLVIPSSQG